MINSPIAIPAPSPVAGALDASFRQAYQKYLEKLANGVVSEDLSAMHVAQKRSGFGGMTSIKQRSEAGRQNPFQRGAL